MASFLRWSHQHFADSTSLFALATAIIFIALYGIIQHNALLLMSILYALIGAIGIYWHQRKLTRPSAISSNDTETSTPITNIPEETISKIATHLGVTVDGLVRASHAINDVTQQQSDSAREQASMTTQANQLLDTFLTLSEQISKQVRQVTQTAQEASDISESGQHAIAESLSAMQDIREQVTAIGETIVTLARLTSRIDNIISSVSEIATQSNLLALNASIEAARAGRHGRGFAVVADEVRTLAKQSTVSASQVRDILSEIQRAMRDTVQATQKGIINVEEGITQTHEANEVIVKLSENVGQSREAVNSIYQVVRQQADGMEEIAISMDRMQLLTQQNLASTRTVESVSSNLTRLANDLQDSIQSTPITTALTQ